MPALDRGRVSLQSVDQLSIITTNFRMNTVLPVLRVIAHNLQDLTLGYAHNMETRDAPQYEIVELPQLRRLTLHRMRTRRSRYPSPDTLPYLRVGPHLEFVQLEGSIHLREVGALQDLLRESSNDVPRTSVKELSVKSWRLKRWAKLVELIKDLEALETLAIFHPLSEEDFGPDTLDPFLDALCRRTKPRREPKSYRDDNDNADVFHNEASDNAPDIDICPQLRPLKLEYAGIKSHLLESVLRSRLLQLLPTEANGPEPCTPLEELVLRNNYLNASKMQWLEDLRQRKILRVSDRQDWVRRD